MYGNPALPADYQSLPYANPDAPLGGTIISGETGGFDSLNPLILKGKSPWQLRFLAYESLMGRNWDEPFSLYGLLGGMLLKPRQTGLGSNSPCARRPGSQTEAPVTSRRCTCGPMKHSAR